MVIPEWSNNFLTFFNLSLNFAIRSLWSQPQSAPGLVFADCIENIIYTIFSCKEYNQFEFGIDHLVTFMCTVFSCVVGRGDMLLWPIHSHGKTLLAFALLHFVFQGQTCLLLQVSLDFLLLHSSSLWWNRHLSLMLVLEGLVGHHGTIQLQLLWYHWLGHRFRLLWYWMVCLGKKQRSFCHFWDCTQILHFRLFCCLWGLLHFLYRILAHSIRYNRHLNLTCSFPSILIYWSLWC